MNKGIIIVIAIIAISIIIYGAMAAQHNKTLANIDQKLVEVDAAAAHMIDVCKSVTDPIVQGQCDADILNTYRTTCVDYPDKLSVCKSGGPVEQYLKEAGYI